MAIFGIPAANENGTGAKVARQRARNAAVDAGPVVSEAVLGGRLGDSGPGPFLGIRAAILGLCNPSS